MAEPLWLERELVLLLHEDIIAETGGAAGVRDEGLLESALARPINRYAMGRGWGTVTAPSSWDAQQRMLHRQ